MIGSNIEIKEPDGDLSPQIVPLSYAQRSLWLNYQIIAESKTAYNIAFAARLRSPLDISALQRACQSLVERHCLLRSNFLEQNGEPVQIIHSSKKVSFEVIDASSWTEDNLKKQVIQTYHYPFDLAQDSLIRVSLFQRSQEDYVLLLTLDHIICDGWSFWLLLDELPTLYVAQTNRVEPDLPPLNFSYSDYINWQSAMLTSPEGEKHWHYWQNQLQGELPVLNLPTDRIRPPIQSYRGASVPWQITPELTRRLKELAAAEKSSLYMVLLAAFQVLLYRYTGQEDLVVGSPTKGRGRPEFTKIFGLLVNHVVLRADLSGNPTFKAFLQQVRTTVAYGIIHQDYPFALLVEKLQPNRDLSCLPLFQVSFVLQKPQKAQEIGNLLVAHQSGIQVNWGGLSLEPFELAQYEGLFDLNLELIESKDCLVGAFKYNTDLFDASTIERMAAHLQSLLEGIVANPEQSIAQLPILSPAELHRLLVEWNDTQTDYPQDKCLHQLFAEQGEQTPEAIAVVFEGQQLTYGELNSRANQLAHYLQSLGVKPDGLVGICIERSLEMVVGLLGILKAGAAYVPIDPTYPPERLAFMIADAQVSVLLTTQELIGQLPEHQAQVLCLDTDWAGISQESEDNPESGIQPDNLAYVIYTSGSTGQPKGTMNTHRGIVNRLLWMQQAYQLTPEDRVLQKTPFGFDVSVWEFFWPLLVGAKLIVARSEGHKDSAYLVQIIAQEQITTLHFVPSMLQVFLESEKLDSCRSLKRVICSGEALNFKLQERFFQRLECELHNLYGPTEAAIDVTYYQCQPASPLKKVPIGRPVANTQIYILAPNLTPVPIGVAGELYIGGVQLARGYLNRPELTREKFIPHPFQNEDGERLYKTGDLVRYLEDGNIEYLGRMDYQLKLRGFRIELGEIEAVLSQQPQVSQTVVIAREDDSGNQSLVAYVVPNLQEQSSALSTQASLTSSDVEQISQWQQVFNETYSQSLPTQDSTFNLIGWNDSYTAQPIPPQEMAEWLKGMVDRILAYQPQRVLEIGCGTGMLMFRIAPHCSCYWGTDISEEAIEYVKQQMKAMGGDWSQVQLEQKPAHDFEGLEQQTFDLVILSSVVQYFPSVDYLFNVLQKAVAVVAEGGLLFVSDVRNLNLLETFHTSVQSYQASSGVSLTALRQQIHQGMAQEEELVVAPGFFQSLGQQFPRISHVQIQLKRGVHDNELTRFRYDVVLHIGKESESVSGGQRWDWQQQQLTLGAVYQHLTEHQPAFLEIKNVPNARLQREVRLEQLLTEVETALTWGKLQEILEKIPREQSVAPEEFWDLSRELPYTINISWSETNKGSYDVYCQRLTASIRAKIPSLFEPARGVKAWRNYANNPLQGKLSRQLIPQLRHFLQQFLPEYMIPSAFVLLDTLPLTPNGKIDRKLLPAPDSYRRELKTNLVAARTPTEEKLVAIWSEILGVEVGIDDNFLELGGHSLLATQVISRVRDTFLIEIPLRSLFENPTVAQLAAFVTAQKLGQVESQDLEQILAEIAELSEEEVKQLLLEQA